MPAGNGRKPLNSKLSTTAAWIFSKHADSIVRPQLKQERQPQNGSKQLSVSEHFEIVEHLAEGVVCDVYKVTNSNIDSPLALKLLRPEYAHNTQASRQFRREFKASVDLTHPNIAAMYGCGKTDDGLPFVIQQFCPGKNLEQLIKDNGPLSIDRAINILVQICDGMVHAHTKAVVHRDLKPSNVIVSNADDLEIARIIDFGMASVVQSGRSAVTDVTKTGEVFGTPLYMSPEQCLGATIDARSDIYSFGCLMYQVLNGSPPFCGVNAVQIIMRQLKDDPPAYELQSGEKDSRLTALELINRKCLEKRPENRYRSFDELQAEIQSVSAFAAPKLQSDSPFATPVVRCMASIIDGIVLASFISLLVLAAAHFLPALAPSALATAIQSLCWFFPEFLPVFCLTILAPFKLYGASIIVLYPVMSVLYHAACESSNMQASLGKRLFKLQVQTGSGYKLSFQHAVARHLLKPISIASAIVETIIKSEGERDNNTLRFWKRFTRTLRFLPTDRISNSYVIHQRDSGSLSMHGILDRYELKVPISQSARISQKLSNQLYIWSVYAFLSAAMIFSSPVSSWQTGWIGFWCWWSAFSAQVLVCLIIWKVFVHAERKKQLRLRAIKQSNLANLLEQ